MIQIQALTKATRFGLIGMAVAAVGGGAYYAYHTYKRSKSLAQVPQADTSPKEKENEIHVDAEASGTDAAAVGDAPNPGRDPDPTQASTDQPVPAAGNSSEADPISEEQRFFQQVSIAAMDNGGLLAENKFSSMFAALTYKFPNSKPRVAPGKLPVMVFPAYEGVNVALTSEHQLGTITLHYIEAVGAEKIVRSTMFKMEMVVKGRSRPEGNDQVMALFVHNKGHELIRVVQGHIHPAYAYKGYAKDGAHLPQHMLRKKKDFAREEKFFEALLAKAMPIVDQPYVLSNAAFINAAINEEPTNHPMTYQNVEGETFIYIADAGGLTNLVIGKRKAGYIQISRADAGPRTEKLRKQQGFNNWYDSKHEVFDFDNHQIFDLAYMIDPIVAQGVFKDLAHEAH